MNLDKLKEAARKFEQREDWRRAIDVYLQAIREAEAATGETTQDPGLYNRVGDLQLKAGDLMAALRAYEEAAELYADQGFFNNAIALCGKILRIDANRVPAYLRLAQLHARKNFVGEARKNLSEYLARMTGPRQRGEACSALEVFAETFSSNPEIRSMLAELLRTVSGPDEAEPFERLAVLLEGNGDFRPGPARAHPRRGGEAEHLGRGVSFHNDLIFLDTGEDRSVSLGVEAMDALLPRDSEDLVADQANQARDATPHGAAALDIRVAAQESPAYHQDVQEGPDFEILPAESARRPADIITADSAGPRATAAGTADLEALDRGPEGAPLEAALSQLESESRWDEALEVAAELIRLDPDSIPRYQKQVEVAYYSGQRSALLGAYLQLAAALRAKGGDAVNQAALVYRRVLVHDPDNETARSGLAVLSSPRPPEGPAATEAAPAAPAPPADGTETDFVDLGALILGESGPGSVGDARIRVGEKPQDSDEDRVFRQALADFREGVESRLDPDDFQSHYDLGIAFKEMGLIDDAIAQFQKALRSPEGSLKAAEQLGIAFFDQGQYGIAEAVLRRASAREATDDEKIGILYWFGRALEAQGRSAEALPLYEQAVALDIRFLDVLERVHRLSAERNR